MLGNVTSVTDPHSAMEIYNDTVAFERTVGVVVPAIFALVIFLGFFGNVLVILVVLRNQQMQNSTNTLILGLAISDLLFLVFCVPFTAADYALPFWVFSRHWCKIMSYLQSVTAYSSVWTLVLMAFDRFLAVVFPVQSMTLRTCRNTMCVVLLVWLIMGLVNVPHLFASDVFRYQFFNESRSVCAFMKVATRNGTVTEVRGLYFSFNVLGYLVPLSITLIFYAFMLHKLWFKMPVSAAGRRLSQESGRNKRRVAYLVATVTFTFAVCWLPLNVCFFITGLKYAQSRAPALTESFFVFQVFAQVLAYTNSCLNPILYAFLSLNFRRGFYQLIVSCGLMSGTSQFKDSLKFERTDIRGQTTTHFFRSSSGPNASYVTPIGSGVNRHQRMRCKLPSNSRKHSKMEEFQIELSNGGRLPRGIGENCNANSIKKMEAIRVETSPANCTEKERSYHLDLAKSSEI